jgi:hypothetical protein
MPPPFGRTPASMPVFGLGSLREAQTPGEPFKWSLGQNPKLRKPKRYAFWFAIPGAALRVQSGIPAGFWPSGFCGAKTHSPETARMPLAGAANCSRSNLKGKEAGLNKSSGVLLRKTPKAKIATDGDFRPRKGLQRKYRRPPSHWPSYTSSSVETRRYVYSYTHMGWVEELKRKARFPVQGNRSLPWTGNAPKKGEQKLLCVMNLGAIAVLQEAL